MKRRSFLALLAFMIPAARAAAKEAAAAPEAKSRKAEFIEKGVRPPMGADPALKNEPASIIPAHITYYNNYAGSKGFFPLFEIDARLVRKLH